MSSLFKTPDIKPPPPPTRMPDPEDIQARPAKRAQMEMMRKRSGRESTNYGNIESQNSGTILSANDYKSTKLG